jgi:hypothetical protein
VPSEVPKDVLDNQPAQESERVKWRNLVALAQAVGGGGWAGVALLSSGYGFCGAYVICILLCPLACALLAETHSVFCGAVAGTSLMVAPALRFFERPPKDAGLWFLLLGMIVVAPCAGAGIGALVRAGRGAAPRT